MTDIKALDALIGTVEAGKWVSAWDEPHHATGLKDYWRYFDTIMHHGSLDAAHALHEALLPGWTVRKIGQRINLEWYCHLISPTLDNVIEVNNASLARAWLIATLKAYRAKTQEGGGVGWDAPVPYHQPTWTERLPA